MSRILVALCMLGLMVAVSQARPTRGGRGGHRGGRGGRGRILRDLTCEVTEAGGTPDTEQCEEGTCALGPLACPNPELAEKTLKFCDVKNENGTSLVVSNSILSKT